MRAASCRSCGEQIVWAETVNGKRVPMDVDPVPDLPGAMLFRLTEFPDREGFLAEFVKPADRGREPELYVSHFATCPNADQHRRTR